MAIRDGLVLKPGWRFNLTRLAQQNSLLGTATGGTSFDTALICTLRRWGIPCITIPNVSGPVPQ